MALGPALASAGTGAAARLVKEGLERFQAGEWDAAARAFAEADVAAPENDRIAFDQACVHAAKGDADKATELFRKAALSRDATLVASAHYNLGSLAAAKAKATFGAQPEAAPPETRTAGMQFLATAVSHYRDCLKVDPQHADARQNLELLRLWIKHMQDLWAKQDRERERKDLDLFALLQRIEAQQTALRLATKTLDKEPDSPRRRQAIKQTQTAQQELTEDIEPLEEKIAAALSGGPGGVPGPGQPKAPSPPPEAQQAISAIHGIADRAKTAMGRAADQLKNRELPPAVTAQVEALDALNEIYMGLAPFEHIVPRATSVQELLVQQSQEVAGQDDAGKTPPAAKTSKPAPAASATAATPEQDLGELSRTQNQVGQWSQAFTAKARQQLAQLPAGPDPPEPAKPAAPPQDADPRASPPKANRATLQKAVEHGPKIHELCDEAARLLDQQKPKDALPKQEEALKLLREIAESLPKQKQDQPKQDQKKDQKEQPKPNEQPQDSGPQKQPQPKPSPQDLSRQQAEAVLRKAKQREREHREREKAYQHYLHGPPQVDRDW